MVAHDRKRIQSISRQLPSRIVLREALVKTLPMHNRVAVSQPTELDARDIEPLRICCIDAAR